MRCFAYARQQQEPVALAKDYQPESGFVPFWEPLGDRKQSLHRLLAKRLPVDKHAHQLAHQLAQQTDRLAESGESHGSPEVAFRLSHGKRGRLLCPLFSRQKTFYSGKERRALTSRSPYKTYPGKSVSTSSTPCSPSTYRKKGLGAKSSIVRVS